MTEPSLVTTVAAARGQVRRWRAEGASLGLVPTMGYLHEGHASLVRAAVRECDRVVVSIFVNPTQFGPGEDLAAYPRDLGRDLRLLAECGCHLVFNPRPEDMYAPDHCVWVVPEKLTDALCGLSRPGHFRGVCTVVAKLFNAIQPDRAYFGQKDAQQAAIIERMVRDLDFPVEIVRCPIAREEDGLARSSRNTYLSPVERRAAPVLNRALEEARRRCAGGETDIARVLAAARSVLAAEPLAEVEYVAAVDAATMAPVSELRPNTLFALAARIGRTRLIDNWLFTGRD